MSKENKQKIIAIDFDGTLCENKWPDIGEPNMKLIWHLTEQREKYGAKLILWTCRNGMKLKAAVEWCAERGLIFDAVNENLPEVVEWMGGDTRKIFADEYIDDRAVFSKYGMTNGDLVRMLDNKQLAEYMCENDDHCDNSTVVPKGIECSTTPCKLCMEAWLDKEVEKC